jgi:RND superfamily putative drug exporter
MNGPMRALAGLVTGPRSRWVVIGAWIVLVAAATPLAMKLPDVTKDSTSDFIPSDSQAARVADILDERFEGGDSQPVLLVHRRNGGLTPADQRAILEQAAEAFEVELASPGLVPFGPQAQPGLVSEQGDVALTVIPVETADQRELRDSIEALREITAESPEGVETFVTGNPALEIDSVEEREKADATLFAVTAILVLTLLIAIYRAPVIALAPLITVGIAYNVVGGILYLLAEAGMTVTGTSRSLLLVLMFGAATDYCLLLVARYVEDLRRTDSEAEAMRVALPRAGPAIVASGVTVIAALLTLSLTSVSLISSLGPVNAIGLAVGLVASLTMLPAMLAAVGRRGFWPSTANVAYTPQRAPALLPGLRPLDLPKAPVTDQHPSVRERDGIWRKVGIRVLGRPVLALVVVLALLGGGALGLTQLDTEANTRADIKADTNGTRGFDVLSERFAPGTLAPVTVMVVRSQGRVTDRDVADAREALEEVPKIGQIGEPSAEARDGSAVVFNVVFEDDPLANAALDRVDGMREALADLGDGVTGLAGGPPGVALDYREGTTSDFKLVVPLVIGVIFLILIALLRAIVAPLYLMVSVVLSFFGILGLSVLGINLVLGDDSFNSVYPVFAFIFLVALGVDYNIFLMDRVREEAAEHGTKAGTLRALVATGPVITSAGLILAGTFAALLTAPTATLQHLGFTVALGVLLDTFLVRTVLVPAVVSLFGEFSWWPSRPASGKGRSLPGAPSGISPLQSGIQQTPSAPAALATPPPEDRIGGA